jgi:hypothetical protein
MQFSLLKQHVGRCSLNNKEEVEMTCREWLWMQELWFLMQQIF